MSCADTVALRAIARSRGQRHYSGTYWSATVCDHSGPAADDVEEIASVVLGQLREAERRKMLDRAEHVHEVLTGYRSGSPELAREGEARGSQDRADDRWVETALDVMVEHTGESKPSRTMVIERTRARVIARCGPDVVPQPSRATAFRLPAELENRRPLFRLSMRPTPFGRKVAAAAKRLIGPGGRP